MLLRHKILSRRTFVKTGLIFVPTVAKAVIPAPIGFLRKVAGGGGGCTYPKTGLESHWDLDEASGSRADSQGSNTLSDNGSVGNRSGKVSALAADFDPASSQYLSHANNASLQTGDIECAFTFWVQFDDLGGSTFMIFSMWGDTDANNAYRAYVDGDGIHFQMQNDVDSRAVLHPGPFSTATWYFIACGRDKANGVLYISANVTGLGEVTTGDGGHTYNSGVEEFRIGANSGASSFYFDGGVNYFDFYKNRNLRSTDADLATLYNSGNGLVWC